MAGVAYAVVHDEPPQVFLAEDVDVLARVLALELVARTDPSTLPPDQCEALRTDLLDERWAGAVHRWIQHSGVAVDVYTHLHIYSERDLPTELIGAQLQFSPLFRARGLSG